MSGLRLLAVGSPLGADRIAWRVAERIQAPLAQRLDGPVRYLDRPGAALVEHLRGATEVVIIDALLDGGTPGEVRWLSPGSLPTGGRTCSSHGFGLAQALALAESLGALPGRLRIAGIRVSGDASGSAGPPPGEAEIRAAAKAILAGLAQEQE